jgi:hypothetical protein
MYGWHYLPNLGKPWLSLVFITLMIYCAFNSLSPINSGWKGSFALPALTQDGGQMVPSFWYILSCWKTCPISPNLLPFSWRGSLHPKSVIHIAAPSGLPWLQTLTQSPHLGSNSLFNVPFHNSFFGPFLDWQSAIGSPAMSSQYCGSCWALGTYGERAATPSNDGLPSLKLFCFRWGAPEKTIRNCLKPVNSAWSLF